MDGRVTVDRDFFRRRVKHAVSTVLTIIFLELIYGRALWLTLFSPRGSAPIREGLATTRRVIGGSDGSFFKSHCLLPPDKGEPSGSALFQSGCDGSRGTDWN